MQLKLLLLFFLSFSFFVNAQVTGTVTDPNGEPLPFVNIYVQNTTLGTTSNAEGDYRLNISQPGNYAITFQFLGFATKTVDASIEELPFTLTVEMAEAATSLDEVVVDASINGSHKKLGD